MSLQDGSSCDISDSALKPPQQICKHINSVCWGPHVPPAVLKRQTIPQNNTETAPPRTRASYENERSWWGQDFSVKRGVPSVMLNLKKKKVHKKPCEWALPRFSSARTNHDTSSVWSVSHKHLIAIKKTGMLPILISFSALQEQIKCYKSVLNCVTCTYKN